MSVQDGVEATSINAKSWGWRWFLLAVAVRFDVGAVVCDEPGVTELTR